MNIARQNEPKSNVLNSAQPTLISVSISLSVKTETPTTHSARLLGSDEIMSLRGNSLALIEFHTIQLSFWGDARGTGNPPNSTPTVQRNCAVTRTTSTWSTKFRHHKPRSCTATLCGSAIIIIIAYNAISTEMRDIAHSSPYIAPSSKTHNAHILYRVLFVAKIHALRFA